MFDDKNMSISFSLQVYTRYFVGLGHARFDMTRRIRLCCAWGRGVSDSWVTPWKGVEMSGYGLAMQWIFGHGHGRRSWSWPLATRRAAARRGPEFVHASQLLVLVFLCIFAYFCYCFFIIVYPCLSLNIPCHPLLGNILHPSASFNSSLCISSGQWGWLQTTTDVWGMVHNGLLTSHDVWEHQKQSHRGCFVIFAYLCAQFPSGYGIFYVLA